MGPKKAPEPDGRERGDDLVDLEDYIKDYIVSGLDDDPILNQYLALVLAEQETGVPLYDLPLLDRPAFFERKIRPWILEGYQERAKISELSAKKHKEVGARP